MAGHASLYEEGSISPQELWARLFTPEGIQDPHAVLAEHHGVRTSWEAANTLLRSPATGRAPVADGAVLWQLFDRWPIQLDGPAHSAFRQAVRAPLAHDAIGPHVDAVRDTAQTMLRDLAPLGRMDALSELFAPLSFVAVWRILGLPEQDRDDVHRLVTSLTRSFAVQGDPDALAALEPDIVRLWNYFEEVVRHRRATPGDDLLSVLATDGADAGLDDRTLAACGLFLVHTHHEEIANGLGNSLVTLLEHPDQLRLLLDDPSLLPTAVEELLRFEPVVQPVTLHVREDVEAGRWTVPAGTHLTVSLSGANRDPEVFTDPHRLDLTRDPNPHLSFAPGPHFCLGHSLARAELEVVLGLVLDRLPEIELDGPVQWATAHPIRQLAALPVRWQT